MDEWALDGAIHASNGASGDGALQAISDIVGYRQPNGGWSQSGEATCCQPYYY